MPTFIASDETSIYYEDFGEGTPIVFICSGNATHSMWEEQVAGLAPKHRTITFDWRGTGLSGRPRSGYTAERAAEDLAELLAQVVAAPAVLVGHGMGGHLAILVAAKHPELVSGLAVASSGPWYAGERDGLVGGMSMEFIEGSVSGTGLTYPDVMAKMTDTYLFKNPVSDIVRTATILQQLEWPLYVLDAYDINMRDLDHRAYLGDITQPTVILHSKHDTKQRFEGASVLQEAIPNAELVVFEDSAHAIQAEEIELFNASLERLVDRANAAA